MSYSLFSGYFNALAVNPAMAGSTEGDTVIDVEAQRCAFSERDDMMGVDGLAPFWLTTTELAGEAISTPYCV
jgi:hypothetical protein